VRAEDLLTIEGRVVAIHGVELRYVEDEPGSRSFRSVPASARLTALEASDQARRGGERFAGYLVDLDAVTRRS
jgi:hypothetical protein